VALYSGSAVEEEWLLQNKALLAE